MQTSCFTQANFTVYLWFYLCGPLGVTSMRTLEASCIQAVEACQHPSQSYVYLYLYVYLYALIYCLTYSSHVTRWFV